MKKEIRLPKPRIVVEWIAITAAVFLCALAHTKHGLRPFAVGIFVGLVYVKRNIIALFPILLISSTIASPVWQSVVVPISLFVVLSLAYLIHRLVNKKVKEAHLLIYTFVALIPSLFIYGIESQIILLRLAETGIALKFCLATINACKVIFVKGLRFNPIAVDELSLAAICAVFALALFELRINGSIPALVLYGFFSVTSIKLFAERGVILNVLIGVFCSLYSGDFYVAAYTAIVGISILALKTNTYVSAFIPSCVHLTLGLILNYIPDYSIYNTLFLTSGVAVIFIPQKISDKLLANLGADKGLAVRSIVNRNRLDIHNRLKKMGFVLKDMQAVLRSDEELPEIGENKNFLAKELASALCGGCPRRINCERILGSSTSVGLYPLISAGVAKGKVSVLDLPTFLIENCNRTETALNAAERLLGNYSARKEIADDLSTAKNMMCESLEGLAGMMDSFSREMKQSITFDAEREKQLLDELSKVNVIASEAAIFESDGIINGFVVVRAEDENKKVLLSTVSKVLGPVIRDSEIVKSSGNVSVSFVSAPKFDVHYGVSALTKKESSRSGDSHSAVRISGDKVMFAICDGMGSGDKASRNSQKVLSLVETFYKADIDESNVLTIINKLLSAQGGEDFSALDMCVVNLRQGTADFIKLGGVQSVIRRKTTMEVVEGGALPIGILENVKPFVCRKQLSGGDAVIMYSDGISDSIGTDGVVRIAEQNLTANPEQLAKFVCEDARFVGQTDDCTVLCLRIYERR